MTFVPAELSTSVGHERPAALVPVRFEVRDVGGDPVRTLVEDPTTERPLPVLRLIVNSVATFVLVLVAGLAVMATVPRLFGYGSVVVVSGSMEPQIRVGDVVVTSPTDGVNLAEGIVINFDYEAETRLHRIVAVAPGGYRTSGDANRLADSDLVSPSQVIGTGIVVVPFIGMPTKWAEDGKWLLLSATLVALVGSMYFSRGRWIEAPTDWGCA